MRTTAHWQLALDAGTGALARLAHPADPLHGAILSYDNDTRARLHNPAWADQGEGREHIGMGILLAQAGKRLTHFMMSDPAGIDYVVYHAWNKAMTDRQMCVDRLDWTDGRPSVARFAEAITHR